MSAFSVFFNTFLAKKLPLIEGAVLFLHVFGFFAVLVPLWILGPRASARQVFTEFYNFFEWRSDFSASLAGMVAAILPLMGFDGAVHM